MPHLGFTFRIHDKHVPVTTIYNGVSKYLDPEPFRIPWGDVFQKHRPHLRVSRRAGF